jgi:hypothetical protein
MTGRLVFKLPDHSTARLKFLGPLVVYSEHELSASEPRVWKGVPALIAELAVLSGTWPHIYRVKPRCGRNGSAFYFTTTQGGYRRIRLSRRRAFSDTICCLLRTNHIIRTGGAMQ